MNIEDGFNVLDLPDDELQAYLTRTGRTLQELKDSMARMDQHAEKLKDDDDREPLPDKFTDPIDFDIVEEPD